MPAIGIYGLKPALRTWRLKPVCFSKRESSKSEADTYYEFAGGKVEGLPVPGMIAEGLSYRGRGAGKGGKKGKGREASS